MGSIDFGPMVGFAMVGIAISFMAIGAIFGGMSSLIYSLIFLSAVSVSGLALAAGAVMGLVCLLAVMFWPR